MRNTYLVAAVLILAVAAVPAMGQTGSYVIEGDLAAGQLQDFSFRLFANLNKDDHVLQFSTAQGPGATPLADTVLTLLNPGGTAIATNDDIGGSLFSRLSWEGITPNNGASSIPIPSPLPGGQQNSYKLRLTDFANNDAGSWRTEILGDAFQLQSIGDGSSTIRSLSMNSADFLSSSSLTITGALTLTGTVDPVFTPSRVAPVSGTFTVGGVTTLTNSNIQVFAGSNFVANGNVILSGGQIAEGGGGQFILAASKTLTASADAQLLFFTRDINDNSTYNLSSGAKFEVHSGALNIGNNATTGTLNVDGAGSTVSTTGFSFWGDNGGTANVTFGGGAAATLAGVALAGGPLGSSQGTWNIQSGATATSSGNISIGTNQSAGATLNVAGANSKLTLTGATGITIGGSGGQPIATNVTAGGELVTGTGSSSIAANGTLNIATGGKVTSNGNLTINGGTLLRDATSTFTLAAGKTLTANNNATVTFTGGFTTGGGVLLAPTKVEVKSGSDFSATGGLDVGSPTPGPLTFSSLLVDGAGSTVETGAGQTFIGTNGGHGVVTVSNGATANFGPTLAMAFSPVVNTDGTLHVNTGGSVTVGTINMSTAGREGSDAVINLVGNGNFDSAVIEQTAGATLTVGSNGLGSATINLSDGASFYAGDATVLATGTINIPSGHFRVGSLTVDGGKVDSSGFIFDDLTARNNADVRLNSSYSPRSDVPIVVESGADLDIQFYHSFGLNDDPGAFDPAVLTVDGLGSSYTGDQMRIGDDNGEDDVVTIRNRASADIGFLSMGLAGTSFFDVRNLSTVTVGSVGIANLDTELENNASGELDVSGGSTVTQTGNSSVSVGNSIFGPGTLRLSGSTFTSGTGGVSVNLTGSLIIQEGIVNDGVNDPTLRGSVFNANGITRIIGGSLSVDGASAFNLAPGNPLIATLDAQLNFGNGLAIPAGSALQIGGANVEITGALVIAPTGAVSLTDGSLSFGSTTLPEFNRITATGGEISGDVRSAGFVDAATLTSLQNAAVDLTGVKLVNTGTLFGDANLPVSLINAGTIETVAGERLRFGGAAATNVGTINNFGGQIRFGGPMINGGGGRIAGRGQFVGEAGWTNQGVMALSGGFADVTGNVNNAPGARIVTSAGAVTTFNDDVVHNGAEIHTAAGAETVFAGAVSGIGPFTGAGDVRFDGALRPGINGPATIAYGGDVTLGPTATMHIDLGGFAQTDQLQVAGDFTLDGALAVQLASGFQLSASQQFLIVDVAGARSGAFDGLAEGALVGAFGGRELFITYAAGNGNDVALFTQSAFTADFDVDGDVDGDDLAFWRQDFGVNDRSDADGDNDSDGNDFLAWQRQLGSVPAIAAAAPVPEPHMAILAFAGLLAGIPLYRVHACLGATPL